MKKHILLFCTLALTLSSFSCVEMKNDESKTEIVSVESEDSKKPKKETDDKKSDSNEMTEEPEEKTTEDTKLVDALTIDEQVLWEVDGVKITATGITEDSLWGSEIDLLIENNSDKDVGISADAVIVNDYMISDLTSIKVTAGNKSNDSITLFSSELEAAGIENIGKVELYLHTFNPETYMKEKESECITITTSADGVDTESDIDGVTLFEQNGIKIVGQYVDEESFWGAAVLLYIENNTNQDIIVQCDDVAINGYMVTSLCSQTVYANKKAITDITLLQSDLEDNGITSVEEVETEFRILDGNYGEIANSGKVKFTTK